MLNIVATPIGNLDDITKRALDTLSTTDLILCEDTRVTKKLLDHYNIKKPVQSLHQHTDDAKIKTIINKLKKDENISYVSDAGTPGVNDPGGKLVAEALKANVTVTTIPGPSALTAAISICGFPMEQFTYLGFAPTKKGRQTFFKDVMQRDEAVIFFESTHRLIKALESLVDVGRATSDERRLISVCREMTKIYETIYRGTAEKVLMDIQNSSAKGESVVIIAPKKYHE
ncbi:MAG: 16S rRNA (cytidine(1402)-2'-O)-methyltransferase [Patescibacteria group bacterium]|nr:16S rRNA (cytidine(1402)-2'-O)-methyltransferase [Patescibacteria group bacterium]